MTVCHLTGILCRLSGMKTECDVSTVLTALQAHFLSLYLNVQICRFLSTAQAPAHRELDLSDWCETLESPLGQKNTVQVN